MHRLMKYQKLKIMDEEKHKYVLPDGSTVSNQQEGCRILNIGRNAFRNRVKSGVIQKVIITDKPNGYYEKAS